jgi:hypothetical protein
MKSAQIRSRAERFVDEDGAIHLISAAAGEHLP